MFTHGKHSIVFKRWVIALVILTFIAGIVAGIVYDYYTDNGFNCWIMIAIWISEVIPIAIIYAAYSHLENQEIQINILNEIRKVLTDNSNQTKKIDSDGIICPLCGVKNPIGAERCKKCNKKL